MFNRKDYVSDKDWARFLEFSKDLETPNIVINLNTIKSSFINLNKIISQKLNLYDKNVFYVEKKLKVVIK